ncbi:type II toxin-antitoxin system RelE/ParE family toxin [Mesorhizobium marinum]|uniref:type II toxin-antitoxin system RelE/ParE family toxin n=1 Tax=Mesorhizobium marinum TaxID=3228790 RepID=UPI0034661D72
MRRLDVEYRQSAQNDLADIVRFLVENGASIDVALKFVLRIEDRCQRIGDAPHSGRPRDDLMPGLRTVPFEHSAVIAYIIVGDVVCILNIFYGGRDFEALYRNEGTGAEG